MPDADAKKDPRAWLVGGALVVAIGFGYTALSGDAKIGCKVTASGVAVIANGLTHGRPTTQIVVEATAGVAAAGACEALVDRLKSDPNVPVELSVQTPQGTGQVSVTASQLTRPPPPRVTCDDWITPDYQQACFQGSIGPPVIDLNPGRPTCEDWLLPSFADACRQGAIGPPAQE